MLFLSLGILFSCLSVSLRNEVAILAKPLTQDACTSLLGLGKRKAPSDQMVWVRPSLALCGAQ